MTAEILRYTAFPAGDPGGNPAGVVLDAHGMTDEEMLAIAAEVGFSETAFLFPSAPTGELTEGASEAAVRYFSPRAEVPFCGHATIAAAVAHAERHGAGRLDLVTRGGLVPVQTRSERRSAGGHTDQRRSVGPPIEAGVLTGALAALGWSRDLLDDSLPPSVAFAGNHHPVLAVSSRQVLADLDYDYDALAALMDEHDWTTMQLVHRESPGPLSRPKPVPTRRGGRGPGHRSGRGRPRWLPSGAVPRPHVEAGHHPTG